MARIKREQDRDEKRDEIVSAARVLFIEEGYEATSISRLASAAGVAPNTIYWYFKDKDEVLVAVLDAVLQEDMAAYGPVSQWPLADQMVWLVERLRQTSALMATVHNRIRVSPALNEWHDRFHALVEALLLAQLPGPLPPASRAAEIRIISFAIEGLVSHDVDAVATRQTCDALAARCLALAGS